MSDNSFSGINFGDPDSKKMFEKQSQMMCPKYKTSNENSFLVNIKVHDKNNGIVLITGNANVNMTGEQYYVKYTAANPPTYSSNFSGSGMPYPTEDIAYENTPNRGVTKVVNGKFSFSIKVPSSYYINMGSEFVKPHVRMVLVDKNNNILNKPFVLMLSGPIPFRTQTWPVERKWSEGPLFYKNDNLPIRTQYQILVDSAYPSINKVPKNFWGLTPSH
jgi:hypothetical protein